MKSKKFKWAIPAAILALSCGTMVALTGCGGKGGDTTGGDDNPPAHTHEYTEWVNTDPTEHWKICPEDDAIDESTRKPHVYGADGKCECGAQEEAAVYGTVTGSVKLHKLGGNPDAAGITVDMGDDDVTIDGKTEGGIYKFTVSDVKVGKNYTLTVSKAGYKSYSASILLEEENETATIGGANGITLEYEAFGLMCDWDAEYHDFSHVNDAENPYILFRESDGSKTLNVLSADSYEGDVSASMNIKWHNSTHNWRTQGIVLKFEDGKHLIVRLHNGDSVNGGNIQYLNELWDFKKENTLFGEAAQNATDQESSGDWRYGEHKIHELTASEGAKIKADGADLNVVLKGGVLYSFFDGKFIDKVTLPVGYAEKSVQVGYFIWNTASNAKFNYDISDQVPAEMTSTVDIDVIKPDEATECNVTKTPDKEKYDLGETVTLNIAKQTGYKLKSLTVGGEDMFNAVEEDRVTITANKLGTLEINAKFEQEVPIALELTVKGKKLGKTEALPQGTQVKFSGITTSFTVDAEGKIKGDSVIKGRYTVSVDGYFSKDIVFDDNLTEIVLEYDAFRSGMSWAPFDNSKQNEGVISGFTNDCGFIFTNESYAGDVAASVYLNTNFAGDLGLAFRFNDSNGMSDFVAVRMEKSANKVQFYGNGEIWSGDTGLSNAAGADWQDLIFFSGENADPNSAAYLEAYNAGTLKLTVLRKGATFYVFLGDDYIGQRTFDSKYTNAKVEAGFCVFNSNKDSKSWNFEITDKDSEMPSLDVAVTDNTTDAEKANGTIGISQNVKLGDKVTITVTPKVGYMIKTVTVPGIELTPESEGVYSFIATETSYTVTATFEAEPANLAKITVAGIDLGNTAANMEGKGIKFTPQEGDAKTLFVTNGQIKGVIDEGTYTVSCDGYYDIPNVTVDANGDLGAGFPDGLKFEKKVFVTNFINEGNLGEKKADTAKAASTGKITATEAGKMYEWTTDLYDDVAFTVTLKSANGNQGLIMCFGNENDNVQVFKEHAVRVRFENSKAQWESDEWWWGTKRLNDRWDFGSGEDYANPMNADLLAKYNGDGLNLTIARKGGMVYALIDGKIYAAQSVSQCANNKVRLALFVEDAKADYEIPFTIEDTDIVLGRASTAVGDDLAAYGGTWTEDATAGTLQVSGGRGYAEFKAAENTVKESAKIHISKANATGDQGIMYRFADGKYIAVRYQENGGKYKVQYTMDTVFFTDGSLKGWTDWAMTDEEKQTFGESGLDLTFIRDGKTFYTVLGDRVLDKAIDLDAKYADMGGTMGIMIWGGSDSAFAYEHKTGDDVTVPDVYKINAYIDGDAHGYSVTVSKNLANAEQVTVKIEASHNWYGDGVWSWFPTAIVVNGVETALTTDDLTSVTANVCSYTYTIDNVAADTTIKFKVTQLACITGLVQVSVNGEGGTAAADSGADGYHWNDGCDVWIYPDSTHEIESITITRGEGTPEVITEGWGTADDNGKITYTVSGGITEQTTIVVKFKATESTGGDTPAGGETGGGEA